MEKTVIRSSAFAMALAVILGALGAHALKDALTVDSLASFQTGVRYHLVHALALFILGLSARESRIQAWRWPIRLMGLGILCFSGSIYLLTTRSLTGLDAWSSFLGPITPIGGLLLIVSWIWLALKAKGAEGS